MRRKAMSEVDSYIRFEGELRDGDEVAAAIALNGKKDRSLHE